jgi:hypothetical protein
MYFGRRYELIVNVDKYPGELLVRGFGSRMICIKCGIVGADVRPTGKSRRGDTRETLTAVQRGESKKKLVARFGS